MKPLLETELLLHQFSDKIKFKVIDIYIDVCKMIIFTTFNKKKTNEVLINSEIEKLSCRLKVFTGIEIYIVTNYDNYLSFVGHSIFVGCDFKLQNILTPRKRRKY